MKIELITSIIVLSSIHSSVVNADETDQIVVEQEEIDKTTYNTLKTLTVLQVLRVDRDDNRLKIDIDSLPDYVSQGVIDDETTIIDTNSNEIVITESTMSLLNENKFLKSLSDSMEHDTYINRDFDDFLKRLNQLENFDLREDLQRYERSMFS